MFLQAHAGSACAFRVSDDYALEIMQLHEDYATDSAPGTTLRTERSAWNKYYLPYCAHMGTSPWRPNVADLTGPDLLVERIFWAYFLVFVMSRMPARPGRSNRKAALPSSGYDVVLNVVRKLGREDIVVPSLSLVKRTLQALLRKFVKAEGPIIAQHKHAFKRKDLIRALSIPSGTKVGRRVIEWTSYLGINLYCLFHTWPETGWRNNEVAAYDGEDHDRSRLSRSSLTWSRPDGTFLLNPKPADYMSLPDGSFGVIMPACSKPDPTGRQWGNKPM